MRAFFFILLVLPFTSIVRASDCSCTQKTSSSDISVLNERLNESVLQYESQPLDRTSLTLKDIAGNAYSMTVLNREGVERAFRLIASREELRWEMHKSGCEMRANQSAQILHEVGIESGKIFADGLLIARSNKDEFSVWSWHAANFVITNVNGKMVKLVLDPAVADRPLTVEEWSSKLTLVPGTSLNQLHFTNRFSYDGNDRNKSFSAEREIVRQRDSALLNSMR